MSLTIRNWVLLESGILSTQAQAQEAFTQYVKEREGSTEGEQKPSVMEYLGLKKKVSDLQQIAHTMQMKVLLHYLVAQGD